jgi:hypothetical protein
MNKIGAREMDGNTKAYSKGENKRTHDCDNIFLDHMEDQPGVNTPSSNFKRHSLTLRYIDLGRQTHQSRDKHTHFILRNLEITTPPVG